MPDDLAHTPSIATADVAAALRQAMASEADVTATFTNTTVAGQKTIGASFTSRGRIHDVTAAAVVLTLSPPPPEGLAQAHDAWATVAIKAGSHELVFFAPLQAWRAGEATGAATMLVSLQLPSEIVTTKRRRFFRSPVTAADGIEVRLWRIAEHAYFGERPRASQRFACELHELSPVGFGATLFARQIEAMQLVAGHRFRVEIVSGETEAVFEARLIHPKTTGRDDASARCGFSFVTHDDDFEFRRSRQKLDGMLAQLQRNAAAAAARSNAA